MCRNRKEKNKKKKKMKREARRVKYTRRIWYIRAFYVLAIIVTIHLRLANDLRASVKRCCREREYDDQT